MCIRDRERDNAPATRARKLSSLEGFYKYLCNKMKVLEINPTDDVETPALKKRLPKYLSLNEGVELLKNVQSDFYERDYCILTLFLNCGMRLSCLLYTSDVYKRQGEKCFLAKNGYSAIFHFTMIA